MSSREDARQAEARRTLRREATRRRRYLDATQAERDAIVEAFRAGVRRKEILEITSFSAKEISNIQNRHGLKLRQLRSQEGEQ
jgi:hypothetical protein